MAYFYLTILEILYFFFKTKEKRKIKETVEAVFTDIKSNDEIKSVKKSVFQGIRFHYYEKLFNAFSSPETLRVFLRTHFESEDLRVVDEGLSKGKGVLLITGHFGGIEFIPGYLAVNNYPVTIVAKFSSKHLSKATTQQAKFFGVRLIDSVDTPNIMNAIYENLRENRIVITLCDEIESWHPSQNTIINFLGKQIYLDKMINVMAKRVKCVINFAVMHRNKHFGYKFNVYSLEQMSEQFPLPCDMSIGGMVLKLLERNIYKYPQEWYQWQKYAEMKTPDLYDGDFVSLPSLAGLKKPRAKFYEDEVKNILPEE
jgi:lauroyl/myristoyl acyltransferase